MGCAASTVSSRRSPRARYSKRPQPAAPARRSDASEPKTPRDHRPVPLTLGQEPRLSGRRIAGGLEGSHSPDADLAAMESVSQIAEHPVGEASVESPTRLALQKKLIAIRALIEHGINGDADQFQPEPVPPLRPEESKRVSHWVEHTAVASFIDSMGRSINSISKCSMANLPGEIDASWSISSDTTRQVENTRHSESVAVDRPIEDRELDIFAAAFAQSVLSATQRLEDNPLGSTVLGLEMRTAAALSSIGAVVHSDVDGLGNNSEPRENPDGSLSGSKSPRSGSVSPHQRNPVLSPALLDAWDDVSSLDCADFEIGCRVTNNFPLRIAPERLNRRLDDPPKYASQFGNIVHALQLE